MKEIITFSITLIWTFPLLGQNSDSIVECEILTDSTIIFNTQFNAYYSYCIPDTTTNLTVIITKGVDTLLTSQEFISSFEFRDFNNDGFKDIVVGIFTNLPNVTMVYLYDTLKRNFSAIENITNFPTPIAIVGTKLYYSYMRMGCADYNWDSDLFYLDNNKAIKIGKIEGRECSRKDKEWGIEIFKIIGDNRQLIESKPIKTIRKYKDDKWGFIEAYWSKNYKTFTPTKQNGL